jgi:predicted phage terminase large subunit-like protein
MVGVVNDQRHGAIGLIMQRLHEDDLVGHVLGQEAWEHLCFPAIAEKDEEHPYMTPWGPKTFSRRKGEMLHPVRQPLEILSGIKQKIGSYFFAAQYQQSPAPAGGGIVKAEWFPRYQLHQKPEFDRVVQSWDTANKVSELAAYSVCTTWGIKGNHVYLRYVFRQKLEFPDLKRAIRAQQQLFGASLVLIEDQASGTQLIQELNRDGLSAVTRYKPTGDKATRMLAQTAMIEDGRVHLPAEAPWVDDYLDELAVFPKGKHADQVDSTSQFLDWFNTPMPSWGVYEFTRREAEKLRHPEESYVRLKAPRDIGFVQTYSGRDLRVEDDGTVAVSEEDARYLIGAGFERISTPPPPKRLRLHLPVKPDYAIGSMEWQAEQQQKKDNEACP